MNSQQAREFVEKWFEQVWVLSSVDNLKKYYDENVEVHANGKAYNRDELIEHCRWGIDNEIINHVKFEDVIAEGNIIAFRFKYEYSNKTEHGLMGENIGVLHLNDQHKIIKIDVKSSEQFIIEE